MLLRIFGILLVVWGIATAVWIDLWVGLAAIVCALLMLGARRIPL